MHSLHQLLLRVKKARASIDRGKRSGPRARSKTSASTLTAGSSTSIVDKASLEPTSSPWDLLPAELQIKIFAHCGVWDLLSMKLVCRSFYQLLTVHEQSIARHYLRQRRHGTLPSPIGREIAYTRNPEDDVVLLSDLFPPSKSAKGGHLYTFRYIHSLRRRQRICSRLCYFLADRVMDRFAQSEPLFMKHSLHSKNERNAFMQRGVASLWFNLNPLMYYTLYFLETYALARREHTNALLRDFEAGRLPIRIPPHIRKSMYRDLQLQVLRSPPFTNTATLISTHHCMELLVSYMRHTVPPDERGVPDDSWIASLLTVSPFLRVVEFFSAEIGEGGSQRMQRKDFMHAFHNDLMMYENDDMNSLVFENTPTTHLHNSTYASRLRDQLTGDVFAGLLGFQPGTTTRGEDDSLSKTGALKNCTWEMLSLWPQLTDSTTDSSSVASPQAPAGILITLEYENIVYKAALLAVPDPDDAQQQQPPSSSSASTSLPLLLTRCPNPLRQILISFLVSNFDTYCSTLRLPQEFLCAALERYFDVFTARSPQNIPLLGDAMRELHLTLSFSGFVAPDLKSLNVSIPRTSLDAFLFSAPSSTSAGSYSEPNRTFLANLEAYLAKHLAMDLDLGARSGSAPISAAGKHVRLSKIACAAFVVGSEGRLKLVLPERRADGADESADGEAEMRSERMKSVLRASVALLHAVIRRAAAGQGQGS
ncbi:F-box domain protein [Aspergillus sp. HF37]|nr:F-box domain protein [Aspergillus sp. HF37]